MLIPDMSENSIPIAYSPGAKDSRLPLRWAGSVAFHNADRTVLIARRNPDCVDEFKGDWSLPSVFLDQEQNAATQMADQFYDWFNIREPNFRLVGKRMSLRKKWRLLMHLFVCDAGKQHSKVVSNTLKYDSVRWVDGKRFFSQISGERLGDCAQAYLDYLA